MNPRQFGKTDSRLLNSIISIRQKEGDQADRIFIVSSGKADNGVTSKDVIKSISGYFRRYRSASGEISDDDIRARY